MSDAGSLDQFMALPGARAGDVALPVTLAGAAGAMARLD